MIFDAEDNNSAFGAAGCRQRKTAPEGGFHTANG
jgi:hypothetical protein